MWFFVVFVSPNRGKPTNFKMAPKKPTSSKGKGSSRDQRRSSSAAAASPTSGQLQPVQAEDPGVRNLHAAGAGKTDLINNSDEYVSSPNSGPRKGPPAKPQGKPNPDSPGKFKTASQPKSDFSAPKISTNSNVLDDCESPSPSSQRCYGQWSLSRLPRECSGSPPSGEEDSGHKAPFSKIPDSRESEIHTSIFDADEDDVAFWEDFLSSAKNVDTYFSDAADPSPVEGPGSQPQVDFSSPPTGRDPTKTPEPESFPPLHPNDRVGLKLTTKVDLGSLSQETKSKLGFFPDGKNTGAARQDGLVPVDRDEIDQRISVTNSADFSFPLFSLTPGYSRSPPIPPLNQQSEPTAHSGPYGSPDQIARIEDSQADSQIALHRKLTTKRTTKTRQGDPKVLIHRPWFQGRGPLSPCPGLHKIRGMGGQDPHLRLLRSQTLWAEYVQ